MKALTANGCCMSGEQPPRFDEPPTTGEQPGDSTPAHPPHPFAKLSAHMSRERMLTADELSHFDDISGSALYRAEVHTIPLMSREEQPAYIEAARAGDTEAKHALLLNCLNWVMWKAHAVHFEYEPSHSDVMDLVGHANVEMMEYLPQALRSEDPVRYLMSTAALAMKRYVFYKDPMVQRPRDNTHRHIYPTTMSGDDGELPLFGVLPADNMPLISAETRERESRKKHQPVYQAIEELPGAWQRSLLTFFGLTDQPAGTAEEVGASLGVHEKTIERHVRYAKAELAQKLAPYVGGVAVRHQGEVV